MLHQKPIVAITSIASRPVSARTVCRTDLARPFQTKSHHHCLTDYSFRTYTPVTYNLRRILRLSLSVRAADYGPDNEDAPPAYQKDHVTTPDSFLSNPPILKVSAFWFT